MSERTEAEMSEMLSALLDIRSKEIQALEAALAKADELALQVDGPHIWMEKVYHAAAAYRQARDATR